MSRIFTRLSVWLRLVCLIGIGAGATGCAALQPSAGGSGSRLLLAYDDGRAEGIISFPSSSFESIVKFTLPEGEHKLGRLWMAAAGAGSYAITFYDSTPLEAPGTPFFEVKRDVDVAAVSDGHDSRWLVQDVSAAPARKGVIWVGIKKAGGEVAIWAARLDAGQYFIRSEDPANHIGFLPVRRTPLVRLEIAP